MTGGLDGRARGVGGPFLRSRQAGTNHCKVSPYPIAIFFTIIILIS